MTYSRNKGRRSAIWMGDCWGSLARSRSRPRSPFQPYASPLRGGTRLRQSSCLFGRQRYDYRCIFPTYFQAGKKKKNPFCVKKHCKKKNVSRPRRPYSSLTGRRSKERRRDEIRASIAEIAGRESEVSSASELFCMGNCAPPRREKGAGAFDD